MLLLKLKRVWKLFLQLQIYTTLKFVVYATVYQKILYWLLDNWFSIIKLHNFKTLLYLMN